MWVNAARRDTRALMRNEEYDPLNFAPQGDSDAEDAISAELGSQRHEVKFVMPSLAPLVVAAAVIS